MAYEVDGKEIVKAAEKIIKEHPEYFEALVEFEKTGELPDFKELKERMNKKKFIEK